MAEEAKIKVRVRTPQENGRWRVGRRFTSEWESIEVTAEELKALRADTVLAVEELSRVSQETKSADPNEPPPRALETTSLGTVKTEPAPPPAHAHAPVRAPAKRE